MKYIFAEAVNDVFQRFVLEANIDKSESSALFIGKMRILTISHYNIIKKAIKDHKHCVVALVSNKNTEVLEPLRLKMLQLCFGDNIQIITAKTANIFSIFKQSNYQIVTVICGDDRKDDYSRMLKGTDVKIEVSPRGVSASEVIKNLDDFEYFKKNTPKEIHIMYNEILSHEEDYSKTKS